MASEDTVVRVEDMVLRGSQRAAPDEDSHMGMRHKESGTSVEAVHTGLWAENKDIRS